MLCRILEPFGACYLGTWGARVVDYNGFSAGIQQLSGRKGYRIGTTCLLRGHRCFEIIRGSQGFPGLWGLGFFGFGSFGLEGQEPKSKAYARV